ncbi:MAG: peptide-methionine (S)-S-oxide reductase MsrA [Actinomycetaceae bacterium]|nr:peptide-methionine (S)-S-oxide reductase MsrA [Actinomycetaceae bacterium]
MATHEGTLPGRAEPIVSNLGLHPVLNSPVEGPWEEPYETIYIGMGCFWGSERIMWRLPGVKATAVGYMGGTTPNPTYEEVCTGGTGHAETVRVVFDPTEISAQEVLKAFWENHDPTTLDRQGNDVGTQYRSAIYFTNESQEAAAIGTREAFQKVLDEHGKGTITTEIASAKEAGEFYLAERYHQAYLHHIPNGYCNHGPNGMSCPIGIV